MEGGADSESKLSQTAEGREVKQARAEKKAQPGHKGLTSKAVVKAPPHGTVCATSAPGGETLQAQNLDHVLGE